jgi:hypothetical protein
MRKSVVLVVTCIAFTLSLHYDAFATTDPPLELSQIVNYRSAKAAGELPPFQADEYIHYRDAGSNTIYVRPFIRYIDKPGLLTDILCPDESGLTRVGVVLYPQTAYTAYLFRVWAATLNGRRLTSRNALPGLPDAGVPNVPAILNPHNRKGVVRTTLCGSDGWAAFTGLPDGVYFAVTDIMWYPEISHWDDVIYWQRDEYSTYDGQPISSYVDPQYFGGRDVYYNVGYGIGTFDIDVKDGIKTAANDASIFTVLRYDLNNSKHTIDYGL